MFCSNDIVQWLLPKFRKKGQENTSVYVTDENSFKLEIVS